MVNLVAYFVQDHPDVLRELTGTEGVVSFDRLVEVLSSRDFPLALDRELGEILKRQEPLGPVLAEAYLPVVAREPWRAIVQSAAPGQPSRDADWVVFATSGDLLHGVTLPQDREATPRISLFARVGDSVRRASVDYASGGESPSGVSMSLPRGCSLPDWGECQGSECGGECELRRKFGSDDGVICWCPHLP